MDHQMARRSIMTRDAGGGGSPDLLRVTSSGGRMVRAIDADEDSGYRDYRGGAFHRLSGAPYGAGLTKPWFTF